MKTKRALLAGLAGLIFTATAAVAGPDTWRRPDSFKPVRKACCAGKSATCPPGGTCCVVKHSYQVPGSGRGLTRTSSVLCTTACAMPAKERGCCTAGCVR